MSDDTFTREIECIEREVEFGYPTGMDLLRIISALPDDAMDKAANGDDASFSDLSAEWIKQLLLGTSDLTEEEVESLTMEGINTAVQAATRAMNKDIPSDSSDFKLTDGDNPLDIFDLDEDGSVDTDDWR